MLAIFIVLFVLTVLQYSFFRGAVGGAKHVALAIYIVLLSGTAMVGASLIWQ